MAGAEIKTEAAYNADYYQKHKAAIAAARAKRYREDPDYREKVKRTALERKKRLREENGPKPRKKLGMESVTHLVDVNGATIEVEMFTSGQLARFFDRTIQTIRIWEKRGTIPKAMYRSTGGGRLYTAFQVQELVKAIAAAKREDGVAMVRERIGSTSFPERARRLWAEYPQGVDLAKS